MMQPRIIAPVAGLVLFLAGCGGVEPVPASPTPLPAFPSEPPAPLPVEDVDFPEFAERTLRNGARLLVVENREQPVVSIQLLLPGAGTAADAAGEAGLASVTASLLDKGTESMGSAEIAEAADFLGARLSAGASSEWSAVSLTSITDFLDRGLALMSDIVLNPTFPEEELETEKTRRISALRLSRSQADALAAETFTTELYGTHPYGRVETAETIGALEAGDLERFHEMRYRPQGALFVVAGDVDPDEIARRIEVAFAGWEGAPPPPAARGTTPTRTTRDMVFVHKPGSVQAVIRIGHLFPSATGADWVTLDVANQVLGSPSAAFTAWMMSTLREEKGYTYGAYSVMTERVGPGTFIMQGEYRNAVADSALSIMIDLAQRLRAGDVPPEHLERAKNYLTGSFPLNIETPQDVAGQVASNRLLGRDDEYLEEYRGEVAEVDAEDVGEAASEHIYPDRMLIVVVGDATEVLDKVRPFAADVRVIDTEGQPVDVASLAAPSEVSFDASGLESRRLDYAVTFQGNEVGSASVVWTSAGGRIEAISEQVTPRGRISQTTTFEAATFAPFSMVSDLGPMGEFEITVEDGHATGRGISMQTGQPQDVDVMLAPGMLLDGMADVAFAVHDFQDVGDFTIQALGATGEVQAITVSVDGTETVDVPAGSFETYRLEVGGPQPMTVWVTQASPHIVVKRLMVQAPIEVVLTAVN